ncbi:diguanylate cyclase domain-containing protein [Geomonas anaerohicana]|uniref:Diguanylate cyclase n=1 Tax=Geomonas anaerohicana TaxID=2798583 RepID=A0ABS0YC73_9BACT|nr:diguanylate cyclase [Geomonas anaerohicana]MBJ6749907.1 diguanylate cyclase [Geomonas anaerohicana]
MTELKRKEAVLRKLASAVEHSPVSVMITDRNGVIEYVNPKFCQVTGYLPQEVIGQTPRLLKGGEQPESFYREMWETILSGREWHGEFHNRNKDGTQVWELASISPVADDSGVISHFVGVKEDISELKRLQRKLGQMAHFDELTGLPNRALFMDRLEQMMFHAHRHHGRVALLFADLDGFKGVNDTLGHQAGDQLLQAVAHRLTSCVRGSDTVARLGGDEFILMLDDIKTREEPGIVARKLLTAFGEPFRISGTACTIGISIGISFYPDDGDKPQALISLADFAMYEAKRAGKNTFTYSSEKAW